jgi:hypothetical protein
LWKATPRERLACASFFGAWFLVTGADAGSSAIAALTGLVTGPVVLRIVDRLRLRRQRDRPATGLEGAGIECEDGEVNVLAERERAQPPPPSVLWETLTDPHRPGSRQWLALADDEVEPAVIEASKPGLVMWSSLWPDRPKDRIRFTIRDDGGGGSRLKWTLESLDEPPDEARLGSIRHRINYLINGEMRESFGQ